MTEVLQWWGALQMASLAGVPMALLLVGRLPDRGYAFLKPLGLLSWGYLLWLAASLRILPNTRLTILLLWLLLAVVALALLWRQRASLVAYWATHRRYVLAIEVLFIVVLVGAAWLRSFTPQIQGTEKPMDLAMLNGVLRSEYFPPQDPWLAGHDVSYYYGGYVLNGMLVKLVDMPSRVGYNVALAGTAALAAVAIFGAGWNVAVLLLGRSRTGTVGSRASTSRTDAEWGASRPAVTPLTGVGVTSSPLDPRFQLEDGSDREEPVAAAAATERAAGGQPEFVLREAPPSSPGVIGSTAEREPGSVGGVAANTAGGRPEGGSERVDDWRVAVGAGGREFGLAPYVCGVLAVVLLLVLGSGEGVLEMLAAHGKGSAAFWDWWNIDELRPSQTTEWYPTEFFFWWRASRTTPDTIVEFPFFSFLLGDLHPHVMALPLGATAAAIALSFLRGPLGTSRPRFIATFAALALFLGSLAWVNTWDLPTLGFVILVAIGVRLAHDGRFRLRRFVAGSAALVAVAVLLYLPFYLTFRSQASGLLPDRSAGTRLEIALLLWAPLLLLAGALLLRRDTSWRSRPELVFAPAGLFAVWFVATLVWEGPAQLQAIMQSRGGGWLTVFGYAMLAGALLARLAARVRDHDAAWSARMLVLLAAFTGVLLLLGAELFYIRDVFDNRMNTVFKLSYQAWQLLVIAGVGGATLLVSMVGSGPAGRRLVSGAGLLLFTATLGAGLTYTVAATMNRTDGLGSERTLDGLAYTRRSAPGEYEMVEWLWTLPADTRVLEAVGRDYSDSARVSARSGLQTVVGWVGHELQWRGSTGPYEGRFEDVEEIYTTTRGGRAIELLEKYGVDYVVVGPLERQQYGARGVQKFGRLFDVAFESGEVTVYSVKARG